MSVVHITLQENSVVNLMSQSSLWAELPIFFTAYDK